MDKINRLDTKKLTHCEYELLTIILKNGLLDRVVREGILVYKFYSYNHQIVRVDFVKGCKTVLGVKVVA